MLTNERIRHLIEMRRELTQIWARSTSTREQLLEQLSTWFSKAEDSNYNLLQLFSQRLKTFS